VRRSALATLVDDWDRTSPVLDRVVQCLRTDEDAAVRKSAATAMGGIGQTPGLASGAMIFVVSPGGGPGTH